MLYLRTLGGVYLSRDGGPPLGGSAGQRRLLGLLAIVSSAGDAGLSRDRIVALLWPDSDDESGRHSLTQAAYNARRTLACEELFIPGTDLRLDARHITSDVRELESALVRDDFENAAALYMGPFLDDFRIPGNGAFERWADAQRRRLQDRIARALEKLAARATEQGNLPVAVDLRRRALVLDPLDTNAARRMIEAMIAVGDRTGALQQAQIHESLVRAELGVRVDPAFRELARSLRAPSPSTSRAPEASEQTHIVAPVADSTARSPTEAMGKDEPAQPTARLSKWGKRATGSAVAIVVIAAGFVGWIARGRSSANQVTPRFDQSVVVAPFRVTGADPALGFLREGLVELLSIRLSGDSVARSIDPGAVLRAWRRSRVLDSTDIQRSEVLQFADRFGADGVVVGSVVGDPRHLVITASLLRVSDKAVQATASAGGPADSLTALVDRIAMKLLAERAGEGERFARRTTPSLEALRAYLAGRSAYRAGQVDRAMRQYERALRFDSTFALAAMHLALSADRRNVAEQHDRALALAWANRDELTDRDRLHLIAFAGPRYPEPSTEAEQLAAWEAAVSASPDRVEALTELAERFLRIGRAVGVANPERRAAAILRRVLEVDSNETTARRQLTIIAARWGDEEQLRVAEHAASAAPPGPMAPFVRWRVALATHDSTVLERIRTSLPRLDDGSLRAIGMSAQFDAMAVEDAERALRIRMLRAGRPLDQLDAILAQHSLALNQGRPFVALDLTEQLEEAQPGSRAHLRLRVLDALYGGGDQTAAERAARSLARFVDAPPMLMVSAHAVQLADACVLAQWRVAKHQLESVRRVIADLRAAGVPRILVPVGANPHMCADLLDALYAVARRTSDGPSRVARLDSLMLGGPAAGDASAYAHIVVARLYERIGDRRRALDAIRRRPYMDGWPRYLATARREEGRLAMLTGDRTGGVAAYRKYLALRGTPETPAAAEVADVRLAVAGEGEPPR